MPTLLPNATTQTIKLPAVGRPIPSTHQHHWAWVPSPGHCGHTPANCNPRTNIASVYKGKIGHPVREPDFPKSCQRNKRGERSHSGKSAFPPEKTGQK